MYEYYFKASSIVFIVKKQVLWQLLNVFKIMSSSLSRGKIILLHVVLIKVCSLNAGNAVFVSKDIDFEKMVVDNVKVTSRNQTQRAALKPDTVSNYI